MPKPATCHPDRPRLAKDLCAPCYAAANHAANREKRCAHMKRYRQAKRAGLRPTRPADCHPDRPHVARGLCSSCYHQSEHAKALRTARRKGVKLEAVATRTGPRADAKPKLRPAQRAALEEARTSKGLYAPVPVRSGAASFFSRKGSK